MAHILIVDNEEKFCKVICSALELEDIRSEYRTSGAEALNYLQKQQPEVVLTDLRMDRMDGLQLLREIKHRHPSIEVIMMTAYASQKTAIEALKDGAFDYLIKPFEMDELILRVKRVLEQKKLLNENRRLKQQENKSVFYREMVGKSQRMQEVYSLIHKASQNDATVLIRGESGTGKELVAHLIHKTSQRNHQPFVTVNCAALPETLLESELFGYEKGAFTGATQKRMGKFEQASGGTLFLDEIGDMSLATQAKLLRMLQNKEIYRLGGNEKIEVDVRIVAATHQNLEEMVEAKQFRNDVYYRLNVFPILLPPLRERKEDIPALVNYFIENFSAQSIDRRALAALMEYDWPGNVRELQNTIERASIISHGVIQLTDLPPNISANTPSAANFELPEEGFQLDRFEQELVRQALQKASGNKTRAAEMLGITRRRLYSMMERYQIHPLQK